MTPPVSKIFRPYRRKAAKRDGYHGRPKLALAASWCSRLVDTNSRKPIGRRACRTFSIAVTSVPTVAVSNLVAAVLIQRAM
jgi:hypothetical protein